MIVRQHHHQRRNGIGVDGAGIRENSILGARPSTPRNPPVEETGWPSVAEWDEMVESMESWEDVMKLLGRYTNEHKPVDISRNRV